MEGEDIRRAIADRTQRVAAAKHALRRAERVVSQACALGTATEAHRRADVALIAVENAEHELDRLHQLEAASRTRSPT